MGTKPKFYKLLTVYRLPNLLEVIPVRLEPTTSGDISHSCQQFL